MIGEKNHVLEILLMELFSKHEMEMATPKYHPISRNWNQLQNFSLETRISAGNNNFYTFGKSGLP